MELVEGDGLDERIARGPIPVDEALPLGLQIAEALEAAHERGIVHRDLKPANVRVRPDGTVKVLDFGLAKAWEEQAPESDPAHSPTITGHHTRAGVILGTAAYMSPEQARGKPVDKRTDVWAFGCVLYEMLAGRRLFEGETVSDVLAAVLTTDPDLRVLPKDLPPSIRRLLARCLDRDPRHRLQAIGEARIAIHGVGSDTRAAAYPSGASADRRELGRRPSALPWAVTLFLAVVAAGLTALVVRRSHPSAVGPVLSYIPAPYGTTFRSYGFGAGRVVVSPDGTRLAFSATDQDGITRIWIRPLGSSLAHPVKGTEDAASPFWSPDGASLGFLADGKLKTITLSDGNVEVLADADWSAGGAWGPNDVILFTRPEGGPIYRTSASGGGARAATKLASDERGHGSPSFLPDGTHFLYTARTPAGDCRVERGSLDSGESRPILQDTCFALYAGGYALFEKDNGIFAQRFRADTGEFSGRPALIAEAGECSAAGDSILACQPRSLTSRLEWFDRSGNPLGTIGSAAEYRSPKISPDGRQILAAIRDPENKTEDLWSIPAVGGASTRLTYGPGQKLWCVWSPDGKFVAYGGSAQGKQVIFRRPSDGSGEAEILFAAPPDESRLGVVDWSPDGRFLSLDAYNLKVAREENWILPLFGARKPFRVTHSHAAEYDGNFSPDGRWLAYFSYESGRPEVYVVPFPGPGGKYQISHASGWLVRWARGGKLFFSTMGNRLMEADLSLTATAVRLNAIRPLFEMSPPTIAMPLFDVTPDGDKFLVVTSDRPESSAITLLTNWKRLLEEK